MLSISLQLQGNLLCILVGSNDDEDDDVFGDGFGDAYELLLMLLLLILLQRLLNFHTSGVVDK